MSLADLRRGKRRVRIQRVRSLVVDEANGYVFPMKNVYDFVHRTALYRSTRSETSSAEDNKDIPLFDFGDADEKGRSSGVSSGAEEAARSHHDHEASFADYWQINNDTGDICLSSRNVQETFVCAE